MNRKQPPWETFSGVQFLRLYKKDDNDNWPSGTSKDDLHPGYPQIVLLDLTADQYNDFLKDPKAFANNHNIYPDPVKRVSDYPKPAKVRRNPGKTGTTSYTVVTVHMRDSTVTYTAGTQT